MNSTSNHTKELLTISANNRGLCPEDKPKQKEPSTKEMAMNLRHAFSKEAWDVVYKEIRQGKSLTGEIIDD